MPRPDYAALQRYDPERAPVRLDLSDNTNLWGTHPAALERIRAATEHDLARYPELYADTLRDAVAARFDVPADCVTTGAGSDDVLDSAFRATSAPGAKVRYVSPTFSMIEPFARMNGMASEAVPWDEALAQPERLVDGGPDLVYVCRPNNPTGESADRAWIDTLLGLASGTRSLVVIDEAYADFAGETLIPVAAGSPRVLVARTASKAYGLAGLRCGFAVSSPETVVEVDKSRGPYKVSTLAAEATAAAMRDEAGWMADTIAACIANRAWLKTALADRGVGVPESTANFLLVPAPSGSAVDDALALRARGIGVRPFRNLPRLGEGLRVTVGPLAMMEAFLTAFDQILGDAR
jgi:histidinol-phosphate aminotransferase